MSEFANTPISETGALTLSDRQTRITELQDCAPRQDTDEEWSDCFDIVFGKASSKPFVPFALDFGRSSGWASEFSGKNMPAVYVSNIGALTDIWPNIAQGQAYSKFGAFRQWEPLERLAKYVRANANQFSMLHVHNVSDCITGALLNNAAFSSLLCSDVDIILQTRLELIRVRCDYLITSYASVIRRKVLGTVRQRLAELLAPEEWEEGMLLPSTDSFQNFISFLGKFPELRAPGIAIADGQFVATWLRTRANIVRLQFDDTGAVKWLVVLAPVGRGYPAQRGVGWLPIDRIRKAMEAFDVWSWLSAPVSA